MELEISVNPSSVPTNPIQGIGVTFYFLILIYDILLNLMFKGEDGRPNSLHIYQFEYLSNRINYKITDIE